MKPLPSKSFSVDMLGIRKPKPKTASVKTEKSLIKQPRKLIQKFTSEEILAMEDDTENSKPIKSRYKPLPKTNLATPSLVKAGKNHIEEYFSNKESNRDVLVSKELFKAERKDVDIRTDLKDKEIVLVNKLIFNNFLLRKYKVFPVFDEFINEYMRLKISLDRKSRGEFVTMNRGDKTQDLLSGMSDFSNIMQSKK